MDIKKVKAVFFSPTGGTRKVTVAVAQKLADLLGCPMEEQSMTLPGEREGTFELGAGEVLVIGTPTYAGKTPNKLLPYLQEGFKGTAGAVALPVVTYGNRSFDNSLAELVSVMRGSGFAIAGAGAFAVRHAFTDELGMGRPSADDLADGEKLAAMAADRIKAAASAGDLPEITVDGQADAPYYVPKGVDGQPAKFLKAKPKLRLDRCCGCGACARRCPMGSIDPEDLAEVKGICIKCQACVRWCTRNARYFDDAAFLSHVKMLEQNFAQPLKENNLY